MASRSTLAVSLVVVIVALSGCSGLVGDDADTETFDYPDGFSESGVVDGDRAAESHEEAVREQGNFTASYRYDVISGDNESTAEVDYRIDFPAERGYQRFHAAAGSSEGSREVYYGDGQRYQRAVVDGEVIQLNVEESEFPADELTAVEAIRPLLTNATDYETRIEERDGTTVAVYEATDLGNATDLYEIGDPDEVTDFEAQFSVDSEGLVRAAGYELAYVIDGEERTLTMTFELSDPGEATVERPDWTDEV